MPCSLFCLFRVLIALNFDYEVWIKSLIHPNEESFLK